MRSALAVLLALPALAACGAGSGGALLVTQFDIASHRPDLVVLGTDGKVQRTIARNAGDGAVSPDGRRVAFVRGGAVWVMGRDGAGPRRLTTPPPGRTDDTPAWSDDGNAIYFSRGTDATRSLFAVRSDGGAVRRVTTAPPDSGLTGEPACDLDPSVSSHGLVVYTEIASCSHGLYYSVREVTAGGANVKVPFAFPYPGPSLDPEYFDASWAPAVDEIAYGIWDTGTPYRALFVSQGHARPRRLASWQGIELDPGAPAPAWSPDGGRLAYVRNGDIWIVNANGTGSRKLTGTSEYAHPSWLH